jgi:tetratricopeptide (TPR) repeat protein
MPHDSFRLAACVLLLTLVAPAPAQPARRNPLTCRMLAFKCEAPTWYEDRGGKKVPGGTFEHAGGGEYVKAEGDYYLVRDRGVSRWVRRDDVLPWDSERLAERLAYFTDRVRRDPRDGFARMERAYCLLEGGESHKAMAEIDEAVRASPGSAVIRLARGSMLATRFKFDEALEDFAVVERLAPTVPEVYFNRGLFVWGQKKEFAKALADCDRALRLAPDDENAYRTRAAVWGLKGDFAKAAADLDAAVRCCPESVVAHYQRAQVLGFCLDPAAVNPKEAVVSARRMCELTDWKDPDFLHFLSITCTVAGYNEESRRWREKEEELTRKQATPAPAKP